MKKRLKQGHPILTAVLVIYSGFVLLPVFWLFITSLKDRSESFSISLPSHLTLSNYVTVMKEYKILNYFANTFVVAIVTTVIIMVLAILAVYGLTKFTYRGSDRILGFFIFLRMIPFVTIIIPLYIMMVKWHLINTKESLILGNIAFNLPVAIWLLVPFFKSFPNELLESAFIDGSSRFRTLWSIVIPLSKPAIMVMIIFTYISTWNEFMYSMIMVSNKEAQVLTVAIAGLTSKYGVRWDLMTPAAILYILPVVAITIIFQKQIIGGMTAGAIKG